MSDPVGETTLEAMRQGVWYTGWLLRHCEHYIHGTILEVGAGIGTFTQVLTSYGHVTAIDINRDYVSKLTEHSNAISGFGDIESGNYFFKGKRFDAIVCFNVLEHIKADGIALANMSKLLNKGGHVVIIVPAHKLLMSKLDRLLGHYRRYSKSVIQQLLIEADYDIVECKYINWWAAIGWFVFLTLLGSTSMPAGKVKIFDLLARVFLWPEKYIRPPFGLSVMAIATKK